MVSFIFISLGLAALFLAYFSFAVHKELYNEKPDAAGTILLLCIVAMGIFSMIIGVRTI